MQEVILKKGKEVNLARKHPWIFSGALSSLPRRANAGDHIKVLDVNHTVLAVGHYHPGSIAVRVLSFEDRLIDLSFWIEKLTSAYNFRDSLGLIGNEQTNAYRLVHGEGDGIPGLIIDVYNRTAVIQCHSVGCYNDRKNIAEALDSVYKKKLNSIYFKAKETLPGEYGLNVTNEYYKNTPSSPEIFENGLTFYIDWEQGQKTGFFLDQRYNRYTLEKYAKQRSVLNCFCYTGGFSMYALRGGATKVVSMDISESATDIVFKNHQLNKFLEDIHEIKTVNVMKALQNEDLPSFDIVVVDPPAFAKSLKKRHNAVQAYKRLNAMAIQKVNPGGFLFTFSCSQVVGTELFYNTITAAAIETGRNIRVIEKLTQSPDHPVNIYHPEGSYLKGLILYVE